MALLFQRVASSAATRPALFAARRTASTAAAAPKDRQYTKTHEWVKAESSGLLTVGITDYAQNALGDIVFVKLPTVGTKVKKGEAVCTVESVKAVGDVYAPADGEVGDVNKDLNTDPSLVNTAPTAQGWLYRLRAAPPAGLLDAAAYDALLKTL